MVQQAYRETISTPLSDVAGELQQTLTRRITAYIVGVRDAKTVSRWASGEISEIREPEREERLRTAFRITRMLLDLYAPTTVKAWFVSLNPYLGDVSPMQAIRDGNGKEAIEAARIYASNG